MLLTLPRLLLARLIGAALLLTVALQAGAPFAAPLERTHGSAFSAATQEVALAGERRGGVVQTALAPQPRAPVPQPVDARAAALPIALPLSRPRATGPPARDDIAQRPAPRAPPFA
jgi:hypothetical protein